MDDKIKENTKKIVDLLQTESASDQNAIIKLVLLIVDDQRQKGIENKKCDLEQSQKELEEFQNNLKLN